MENAVSLHPVVYKTELQPKENLVSLIVLSQHKYSWATYVTEVTKRKNYSYDDAGIYFKIPNVDLSDKQEQEVVFPVLEAHFVHTVDDYETLTKSKQLENVEEIILRNPNPESVFTVNIGRIRTPNVVHNIAPGCELIKVRSRVSENYETLDLIIFVQNLRS